MKQEKGISLIMFIILIVAIILVGGFAFYFIMTNLNLKPEMNNDITQNQEITNKVTTNINQNSQLTIDEIKKQNYPEIFGSEGTGIYPPQSYITHNILSINPNKDEKFIVTNASSHLGDSLSEKPTFTYLINEKDKVEIEITFKNPNSLILQENVNNTEIFVYKNGNNPASQDLKRTRYILLDDIPYYYPNNSYSNDKCYIVLKPSTQVENTEIVKIAQHIIVDKTRGEFVADGDEGLKIVADMENFKKIIGNYTLNFENVIITDWRVYKDGLNELNYFLAEDEKNAGLGLKIEFPYVTMLSNSKSGIEDIRDSIDRFNSSGLYTQELAEIEVDGIKFYGLKENISSNENYFTYIYVELEGNQLIRFSKLGKVEDIKALESIIRNLISNKILYKN